MSVRKTSNAHTRKPNVNDIVYRKKKGRHLYTALKKAFKGYMKRNFNILKNTNQPVVVHQPNTRSINNISMYCLPDEWQHLRTSLLSNRSFDTSTPRKKRKIDSKTYRKRCAKGLDIITTIISRAVDSRKRIILDVFEELRHSNIYPHESQQRTNGNQASNKACALQKSLKGNLSKQNSRTEPSTEVEHQVFDKTDLDYYFLERLEKMRDMGVREEDYALIEQEEKFSLERAENSYEDDLGYLTDSEPQQSDSVDSNEVNLSQNSEKPVKKSKRTGSRELNNGRHANYEEDEQVYFGKKGDIETMLKNNPSYHKTYDDMGNSSVITLELKSLLKD